MDAWRALAALAVVTYHSALPAVTSIYPALGRHWFFAHIRFGAYGVQLFFVISGYCIAQAAVNVIERRRGLGSYLWARARRIYPPYAAATLVAISMGLVAHWMVAHHLLASSSFDRDRPWDQSRRVYLCSALLLQQVCHVQPILPLFWTLCYEAAFYLVVGCALLLAMRRASKRDLLDACHALTLATALFAAAAPDRLPYPLDLWPEFGLGMVVFDYCTQGRRRSLEVLFGAVLAAVLVYAFRSTVVGVNPYRAIPGEQAIVAAAFAVVLLFNFRRDGRVAGHPIVAALGRLGVFSYSLYLVHLPALAIASQVAKRLHIGQSAYGLSMVLQVAAAVPAAYLFFLIAEQPFIRKRRELPLKPEPQGHLAPAIA